MSKFSYMNAKDLSAALRHCKEERRSKPDINWLPGMKWNPFPESSGLNCFVPRNDAKRRMTSIQM